MCLKNYTYYSNQLAKCLISNTNNNNSNITGGYVNATDNINDNSNDTSILNTTNITNKMIGDSSSINTGSYNATSGINYNYTKNMSTFIETNNIIVAVNYTKIICDIAVEPVLDGLSAIGWLTSMKTAPKFLFAFTLFLNDLWLYKFHRKFQPQYPNSTLAFMDKIDIAKELQIRPAFLDDLNFLSSVQVANANNALLL